MTQILLSFTMIVTCLLAASQTQADAKANKPAAPSKPASVIVKPAVKPTAPTPTIQSVTSKQAITRQQPTAEVMQFLKQWEAAGAKITTVKADMLYTLSNTTLGDRSEREGWVRYVKQTQPVKTPNAKPLLKKRAKFRAHYETLKQRKGKKIRRRKDYAFDGDQTLSISDETTKQITRIQFRPPETDNGSLGSPFPMPFGQKAQTVLNHYVCTTRKPNKRDPAGTVFLKLIPHHRKKREFTQIWLSKTTWLPLRISSLDRRGNLTTVNFSNTETNVKIPDSVFQMRVPFGWSQVTQKHDSNTNLLP